MAAAPHREPHGLTEGADRQGANIRSPIRAQGLALAVLAGVTLSGAPAVAGPLPDGGVTAAEVVKELQTKGYKAQVSRDNTGDPMISSASDGVQWKILFYGCNGHPRCSSIQFAAGFDLPKGMAMEKINAWNRNNRFGRAYLDDENDPYIEMDVDAEHGFSSEAVANNIETWLAVATRFHMYIG